VNQYVMQLTSLMHYLTPGDTNRKYMGDRKVLEAMDSLFDVNSNDNTTFQKLFLELRKRLETCGYRREGKDFYKRVTTNSGMTTYAFKKEANILEFIHSNASYIQGLDAWRWLTNPPSNASRMYDFMSEHPLCEAPDIKVNKDLRSYEGDEYGRGSGLYDARHDMFFPYALQSEWQHMAELVTTVRRSAPHRARWQTHALRNYMKDNDKPCKKNDELPPYVCKAPNPHDVAVQHMAQNDFPYDIFSETAQFHKQYVGTVWREAEEFENKQSLPTNDFLHVQLANFLHQHLPVDAEDDSSVWGLTWIEPKGNLAGKELVSMGLAEALTANANRMFYPHELRRHLPTSGLEWREVASYEVPPTEIDGTCWKLAVVTQHSTQLECEELQQALKVGRRWFSDYEIHQMLLRHGLTLLDLQGPHHVQVNDACYSAYNRNTVVKCALLEEFLAKSPLHGPSLTFSEEAFHSWGISDRIRSMVWEQKRHNPKVQCVDLGENLTNALTHVETRFVTFSFAQVVAMEVQKFPARSFYVQAGGKYFAPAGNLTLDHYVTVTSSQNGTTRFFRPVDVNQVEETNYIKVAVNDDDVCASAALVPLCNPGMRKRVDVPYKLWTSHFHFSGRVWCKVGVGDGEPLRCDDLSDALSSNMCTVGREVIVPKKECEKYWRAVSKPQSLGKVVRIDDLAYMLTKNHNDTIVWQAAPRCSDDEILNEELTKLLRSKEADAGGQLIVSKEDFEETVPNPPNVGNIVRVDGVPHILEKILGEAMTWQRCRDEVVHEKLAKYLKSNKAVGEERVIVPINEETMKDLSDVLNKLSVGKIVRVDGVPYILTEQSKDALAWQRSYDEVVNKELSKYLKSKKQDGPHPDDENVRLCKEDYERIDFGVLLFEGHWVQSSGECYEVVRDVADAMIDCLSCVKYEDGAKTRYFRPHVGRTWHDCDTAEIDTIYDCQNFTSYDKLFLYGLKGRLFFDVGDMDSHQMSFMIEGIGGCGKSTIMNAQQKFWPSHLRGTLSSNIQPMFGMSAVCRKGKALVVFCNEVSAELQIVQEEWQTSVSGEEGSYNVKHEDPLTLKWIAQHFWVGNSFPTRFNNQQGQVSRRLAGVIMPHPVQPRDGNILFKITLKLGNLQRREVLAYHDIVRFTMGSVDPMSKPDDLPPAFRTFFEKGKIRSNVMHEFLHNSGAIEFDNKYSMRLEEVKKLYDAYRLSQGLKPSVRFSEDVYRTPFMEKHLKVIKMAEWTEMIDGEANTYKNVDIVTGMRAK